MFDLLWHKKIELVVDTTNIIVALLSGIPLFIFGKSLSKKNSVFQVAFLLISFVLNLI